MLCAPWARPRLSDGSILVRNSEKTVFFGGLYTELDGDRLGWQAVPSGWCPLVVRFGHRFGG